MNGRHRMVAAIAWAWRLLPSQIQSWTDAEIDTAYRYIRRTR